MCVFLFFLFFFFNDTATTEIYTLSLHDALPIYCAPRRSPRRSAAPTGRSCTAARSRSEEHTSELQSRVDSVCRLLLEKKKRSKSLVVCQHCHNNIHPGQPATTLME